MDSGAVTNLLEDAYLVLQYAVRAGRLPDATLPNAIREVEANIGAGGLAGLVPLSNAMNGAVTAIAPITLVDLRAGRSPFDKDHRGSSRKLQYSLCGLTVLLAAFIAFYSFSVQRKEGALREYQDVRAANIPEKVDALYRLVQQEEVRTRKDPRFEQYQRSLNEIQGLDARDQAALQLLAEQSLATGWPFHEEVRAALTWISRALPGTLGSPGAGSDLPETPSRYENMCDAPAQEASDRSSADQTGSSAWRQVVLREQINQSCFKEMMGIKHGMAIESTSLFYTAHIRDNVVLLNVWILPFLSGLLGATVFLLRDSLNPLTANFGLARVVVRLALGGVAGIIIGWFWVPTGTFGTQLGKGSSIPMALAFLTGFSIDILFSALDRLKGTLTAAQEPAKATPR
jgi:hypothetical protein